MAQIDDLCVQECRGLTAESTLKPSKICLYNLAMHVRTVNGQEHAVQQQDGKPDCKMSKIGSSVCTAYWIRNELAKTLVDARTVAHVAIWACMIDRGGKSTVQAFWPHFRLVFTHIIHHLPTMGAHDLAARFASIEQRLHDLESALNNKIAPCGSFDAGTDTGTYQ